MSRWGVRAHHLDDARGNGEIASLPRGGGSSQEFADFAKARDIAYNHSPPFELPYKVEQDKIDGKTIKYSFNRDEKWTAALKYVPPGPPTVPTQAGGR
jgi:hypothetical protein